MPYAKLVVAQCAGTVGNSLKGNGPIVPDLGAYPPEQFGDVSCRNVPHLGRETGLIRLRHFSWSRYRPELVGDADSLRLFVCGDIMREVGSRTISCWDFRVTPGLTSEPITAGLNFFKKPRTRPKGTRSSSGRRV